MVSRWIRYIGQFRRWDYLDCEFLVLSNWHPSDLSTKIDASNGNTIKSVRAHGLLDIDASKVTRPEIRARFVLIQLSVFSQLLHKNGERSWIRQYQRHMRLPATRRAPNSKLRLRSHNQATAMSVSVINQRG